MTAATGCKIIKIKLLILNEPPHDGPSKKSPKIELRITQNRQLQPKKFTLEVAPKFA